MIIFHHPIQTLMHSQDDMDILVANMRSVQPYLKAFAQHFGDFGQGLDRWIALGGMLQPLVRLITDAQFPGHLDLWTSSSRFA